jgi:hypothetical protein
LRARQTDRVTSSALAGGRDRVLVRIKRIGELSCNPSFKVSGSQRVRSKQL